MNRHRPEALRRWTSGPVEGCPCGRVHEPGVRDVLLGPGLIDSAAAIVPPPRAGDGPVLLLADPETWDAAGSRVHRALKTAGFPLREAILPRDARADDREIEGTRPALASQPSRVVSIGSGTISDLGKVLSRDAGVPLTTFGTAASMNGYASSIAALTVRGLKVTVPAPAPECLALDTDVLADAPPRLTRAGFGDLLSKPVAGADWVVAHLLVGETLCPTALALADDAVRAVRALAPAIGRGERDAVAALAEALVLSGISMHLAGASSPASGGEHLLSHYLDMSVDGWSRNQKLHGEQVAVGTLASLALYRRLPAVGPPEPGPPAPEPDAGVIRALHAQLSPEALAEVVRQAEAKASRKPARRERRLWLAGNWAGLWRRLEDALAGAATLRADLAAAGAPTSFSAIDVPREMAVRLIVRAAHIRDRYTVLDLAADLGVLDTFAAEIAAELE